MRTPDEQKAFDDEVKALKRDILKHKLNIHECASKISNARKEIEKIQSEPHLINTIIDHYNTQLISLEQVMAGTGDVNTQRQIKDIMRHYKNQIVFLDINRERLQNFRKKTASYCNTSANTQTGMKGGDIHLMEEARFSQEAIEWWPYLKELVEKVNRAADTRDRKSLDNTFIEAINILKMKIEHQEVKQAEVVTVANLKEDLFALLQGYKHYVKNVAAKRRRLNNPIEEGRALKESTRKQYQSIVKMWPEKQREFVIEIQNLNADIKRLRSSVILKLRDGMVLTVHHGGQYPVMRKSKKHLKEA